MSPYTTTPQLPSASHALANAQPFNFMGLPIEVRLMIYELVVVADDKPLLRSRDEMIKTYQRGELADSEYPPTIQDPNASKLFNWMGLPPSVRGQIQGECHAAGSRTILTSRDEMIGPPCQNILDRNSYFEGSEKFRIPLAETSMLQVSWKTHDEALAVFYRKNRFHYSITVSDDHHKLLPFSRNASFLKHLPLMKHISLDLGDCIDNFWRKYYSGIAERILPPYLEMIERCCTKDGVKTLKSLDLSLMSLPADDMYLYDEPDKKFNDLLVGPGPISQALRRMKNNIGALSIVGIGASGPKNVLAGLCSEVVSKDEWQKETWSTWRGKKLDVVPVRKMPEITPYLGSQGLVDGKWEGAVHCWRLEKGGQSSAAGNTGKG